MDDVVSRRAFLKHSLATGAAVAAGVRFPQSVMAQPAAGVTAVDKLTVWVLTDNYFDSNRPDARITKRFRAVAGRSIHAEHGVSFFVETTAAGKTSSCMFDYGLDAAGVLNNMALLGTDVGRVDAFGLSHGHYDHYTNAAAILKQNQSRLGRGTPFYVGEEAFAHRYSVRPGATEPTDLGQLKREDLEGLGVRIVEVKGPVEIAPGAWLTGNIGRVTAYETPPPTLLVRRGERLEPDVFPGEQAMFFDVKGKGLVVLSGCAHAGIVNTVRQAQRNAGTDRVHAIMGGFHLISAKPEVLKNTVADIKAMKPDYVVPAHCSGFETLMAFSREMPDQFILNTAGTQYTFTA